MPKPETVEQAERLLTRLERFMVVGRDASRHEPYGWPFSRRARITFASNFFGPLPRC